MKSETKEAVDRNGKSYLVLWWFNQVPYAARFNDEVEAEMAAKVRNAVIIEVEGAEVEVSRIVDYYRRDDDGNPMPATWKDLADNVLRKMALRWPSLV